MEQQSIFAMAAASAKQKTTKSKSEKTGVVMTGNKPAKYTQVKNQIKDLEAEKAMLDSDIKSFAKQEYLRMFKESGVRPESFNVVGSEGGTVLFMVQDRYTSVSEDKAAVLEQLGVVETTTTFAINPAILAKYEKEISAALFNAIPADEWGEIFQTTKVQSVKSGTIERLNTIGLQHFDIISPITMLK